MNYKALEDCFPTCKARGRRSKIFLGKQIDGTQEMLDPTMGYSFLEDGTWGPSSIFPGAHLACPNRAEARERQATTRSSTQLTRESIISCISQRSPVLQRPPGSQEKKQTMMVRDASAPRGGNYSCGVQLLFRKIVARRGLFVLVHIIRRAID